MKRKLIIIIIMVSMLLVFVGCANESEQFAEVTMDKAMPQAEYDYMEDEKTYGDVESSNRSSLELSNTNQNTTNQKVIKNGSVTMEVINYANAISDIKALMGSAGYIEQSNIWKTPRYVDGEKIMLTNANISIRVPKEQFESFIEELDNIGIVINQSTSSDDISHMYYDTEARVQLKLDEKVRLEEYLNEIEDAKIYFEIQSRITDVIFEIEQLKGNILRWDNQIEYSNIFLTINEIAPDEDSTITEPKGFFGKIWDNMIKGVKAIGSAIVFFAGAIPAFLIIAIFVFVIVKIARRKKTQKKNTDK